MARIGYFLSREQYGPEDLVAQAKAADLPRRQGFADAMALVSRERVAEAIACGDDPKAPVERVRQDIVAGVGEVCVQQVGADHEGFVRGPAARVLPELP